MVGELLGRELLGCEPFNIAGLANSGRFIDDSIVSAELSLENIQAFIFVRISDHLCGRSDFAGSQG